jgi:murein DD-endopeptidase MepM/ murein hydrolase activator NlpD
VNARILTRLNFGEKVEILARTENPDVIDGTRARWYMVRRTNGEEGWVFGKFLRANPPERKGVEPEKDKNRVLELTNDEGLSVPVIGKRTSDFGYRIDPLTHKRNAFHSGIDIAAPSGTPVKAAADGVIKISEFNAGGYGNLIVVLHEKEVSTYYGHLSRRDAMNGQRVKKGDVIGLVGSTGRSTGPHLHFEVRKGNSALDPNGYIK